LQPGQLALDREAEEFPLDGEKNAELLFLQPGQFAFVLAREAVEVFGFALEEEANAELAEPLEPQVGQLADLACPQPGQEALEVAAFELKLLKLP